MREEVTILIATWNNEQQLSQCLISLWHSSHWYPLKVIVINNGDAKIEVDFPNVTVVNTGKNLGWEGGLLEGLKHVTSEYVCFMNDDTYIPPSSFHWMKN